MLELREALAIIRRHYNVKVGSGSRTQLSALWKLRLTLLTSSLEGFLVDLLYKMFIVVKCVYNKPVISHFKYERLIENVIRIPVIVHFTF